MGQEVNATQSVSAPGPEICAMKQTPLVI